MKDPFRHYVPLPPIALLWGQILKMLHHVGGGAGEQSETEGVFINNLSHTLIPNTLIAYKSIKVVET